MKNLLFHLLAPMSLAAFLALTPVSLPAQSQQTTQSPSKTNASTEKKQTSGPFHGKLAAVDKTGRNIVVGKRTFHITAETKILKDDKPAKLEDGVIHDVVSGYFKTAGDGSLQATTVRFGPKTDTKTAEKKKK